tara:strand:+ start:167 stop:472 length:306 start_codon:yes stop_codon:yes gene_type:complete
MYDHEAIRKAYPNVKKIDDSGVIEDFDGNTVTVEQSKVDAARIELNKLNYQIDRKSGTTSYGTWREQLAMLYDDMLAGKLDSTGSFFAHNESVKKANPKPS